jgi:hypothetical protein
MVVHELPSRTTAENDARAETRRGGPKKHRDCGQSAPPRSRSRVARLPDVSDEAIPATRQRLQKLGVRTQSDPNLPDGEVDVLVVRNGRDGPKGVANLLTRHDFTASFDQQREQLRWLRL